MVTKGGTTPPPTHTSGATAANHPAPAAPSKKNLLKKFAPAGGYLLAILVAILAFFGLIFPKEARDSEARDRIERLEQTTKTTTQVFNNKIAEKADQRVLANLEKRLKSLEDVLPLRLTSEQLAELLKPLQDDLEKLEQEIFPFGESPPSNVIGHQPIR